MILTGSIIGRSHRLMQQNCQDFAIGASLSSTISYGLVLDGCGSKYRDGTGTYPSHNEVGANLLGQYAAAFLSKRLTAVRQSSTIDNNQLVNDVLVQLYGACATYLDCFVTLHPFPNKHERKRFIATCLLSTLVGFVVTAETAVCFWSGDGYLGINDAVIPLDCNNRPDYLAYQLLPGGDNGRFHLLTIRDRSALNTLAVATDGWQPQHLRALNEPANSLALQRWINIQARERGSFEDDGAIAIYYKSRIRRMDEFHEWN